MKRSWPVIIAVGAGFLLVILLGVAAYRWILPNALLSVSQEPITAPEQVEKAARNIIAFSPPPDFEPEMAYQILDTRFVSYRGPDESSQIMIYESAVDASVSDTDLQEQYLDLSDGGEIEGSVQVDVEEVTIAGRAVSVGIFESDLPEERTYRMASTMLHTSPGRAVLVMFTRPLERWSQAEMKAFFESIKP